MKKWLFATLVSVFTLGACATDGSRETASDNEPHEVYISQDK